jgi:hypothetical protein
MRGAKVDDAKIEAMRAVLGEAEKRVAENAAACRADTRVGPDYWIPAAKLALAIKGWRELVDKAEAERAKPVRDAGENKAIEKLLDVLRKVAPKDRPHSFGVRLQGTGEDAFYATLYADSVRDAVQAIEALLDAKQATPPEPTLEECVAAINRARHRGLSDWTAMASSVSETLWLNADETRGLGRLLIDRERAAKGGA